MDEHEKQQEQAEHQHPAVRRALGGLTGEARELAEHAWQWVYGPEGPGHARRHRLQTFLWYGLPRKWLAGVDEHLRTAAALGRLCEALGLPAHAAVCRSEETREILLAWDADPDDGFSQFVRALDRSGLDPPDTDALAWSSMMSADEADARDHVAGALEDAVEAGRLRPGARGWREEQRRVTVEALHEPIPGHPGRQTWLQTIVTARLGDWMHGRPDSPRRQGLLRDLEPLLLHPAEVPADAAEIVAPLQWLLRRAAGDGLPLTERGYLARAVVAEAVETFGWQHETFGKSVQSEVDLLTPRQWHELIREQRWARRRGRRLLATKSGSALVEDVEAAWRALCAALAGRDEFEGAVLEAAMLVLLSADGEAISSHEVNADVAGLVAEAGWRLSDGSPLEPEDVRFRLAPLLGDLRRFGLLEDRGFQVGEKLTPGGRAAALEILHRRAVAPRHSLAS